MKQTFKQINIKLTPDLRGKLEARSRQSGESITTIVRRAVVEHLQETRVLIVPVGEQSAGTQRVLAS